MQRFFHKILVFAAGLPLNSNALGLDSMAKQTTKKRCFAHLSYEERVKIECLQSQGHSIRDIARLLNRSCGSICRELEQKRVKGMYTAKKAHLKTYQRRYWSKFQSFKALPHSLLIEEKLGLKWSPERIAGYLGRHGIQISPKAIYKYVHSRCLERYLWKPKRQKRLRTSYLQDKRKFTDRKPVFETGHWEVDFIVGSSNNQCLFVAVDRYSRLTVVQKLENKTHVSVFRAFEFLCQRYIMKTVTADNDVAFGCWKELEKRCKFIMYFTHPYRSWEKPLVEQTNKMIRQFVPKKTNLRTVSERKMGEVHRFLNQTPRQCLNYLTAYEKHYSA